MRVRFARKENKPIYFVADRQDMIEMVLSVTPEERVWLSSGKSESGRPLSITFN
jgi:hypothetical protein